MCPFLFLLITNKKANFLINNLGRMRVNLALKKITIKQILKNGFKNKKNLKVSYGRKFSSNFFSLNENGLFKAI